MTQTAEIEIACDESGNDGENIFGGNAAVFAHASTCIPQDKAEHLIAELRQRIRSQAAEMKSKDLLKPKNHDQAVWFLTHLDVEQASIVHLTEKRYLLTTKFFDATVEEEYFAWGLDLYEDDHAVAMAEALYLMAPFAFGAAWDELLESFNALLRVSAASDIQGLLSDLTGRLRALTAKASPPLAGLLGTALLGTRHLPALAELQLGVDGRERLRTLDPLLCSIGQTARSWSTRVTGSLVIIHDDAKLLSEPKIQEIKRELARPENISPSFRGIGVTVADIKLVDSRTDARVQVADLLAGIGRAVGEEALVGNRHPLQQAARPLLDPEPMWGHVDSYLELYPSA